MPAWKRYASSSDRATNNRTPKKRVTRPGGCILWSRTTPLGYGHAVYCAREFVGKQPFLHLVGDHLYISRSGQGCASHLVQVAENQACSVSAVQPTRENLLPYFGTVGGQRIPERPDLYRIERVIEKPTPTKAEQQLIVPGLRAGHYLCFLRHACTDPDRFRDSGTTDRGRQRPWWNHPRRALDELARREQYLALEMDDLRYDIGVKYGLMNAQMALASERPRTRPCPFAAAGAAGYP